MARFDRVGVVVPAKDEERRLSACLHALDVAAADCPLPVDVLVVLDSCTDRSAEIVAAARLRHCRLRALTVIAGSVGTARGRGMAELIGEVGRWWLATTDADTVVPGAWLRRQLAHAEDGAAVVLGTIEVGDWDGRPLAVRHRAEVEYLVNGHRHIHGANLAFAADAYLRAGGFRNHRSAEDVALVRAFQDIGAELVWATDLAVRTSGRRISRAPGGFAGYLDQLAERPA